jgi:hypothetical protein
MLAEGQRLSLLQAIGIDVYRRRAAAPSPARAEANAGTAGVVVVCRDEAIPARFRAQLPRALGVVADHLRWCGVDAAVPGGAAAYVVVGTEAARALGVQLSTMQQNDSIIATTTEPTTLLQGGAAKRALWQVLKPVARRVRGH